ncbi:unnamed protein product [Meganyctiphanes norvegica]|uniref:Uncharacterized protein n=1 Tax=Meganyctiphanes norvegica TaxID=48144 RepID=A0AAV2QTC7_MEGNR
MNKLKSLVKGGEKSKDAPPQKLERGVPVNVEEFRSWLRPQHFRDLPPRGQEAFFKFLRSGKAYPEDVEITEVRVNEASMTDNSRRYQFWLKCHKLDLNSLYRDYFNDSLHRLPEAPFAAADGGEEKMDTLRDKAAEVNTYISKIRTDVEPELNTAFDQFKKHLTDKCGQSGERL